MAEVLLFHHALGQTEGFAGFADELQQAGHSVHTPDLFDGRTFAGIDEGMTYAEQVGFPDEIADSSLPSHDAGTAALLTRGVLDSLQSR
jgi:dienelactone hydrolase